ncbi:AcrR family transcriptional regulator [Nakamurella sp. UYEF19]|uniref:TetR/AcrR family transcriptional regulator n=1 Tax=Nakamurella sp. UYEF19 TaxID=1756392 RepID=UPI0033943E62
MPRAVREQQLLELAERLFIESGYGAFSIEDLCREAGVSRPIIYDHFGSRDGLYLACLRRVRAEFENTLINAARDAPDAEAAIRQGADAFFTIIERDPRRWSLVYGGLSELGGTLADQIYELRTDTIDRISAITTRFAPHADREAVTAHAHAVSGAGEQMGRWWLHNPDIPRERIVDHFCTFARMSFLQLPMAEPDLTAGSVPAS